MRWLLPLILVLLVNAANAADGRVYKVLPQFLDEKGHESLSPSLYDRDAYQAELRKSPAKRSAIQFAVQWKAAASTSSARKLRVELRGAAHDGLPGQTTVELPLPHRHWFSHWDSLKLEGEKYKAFGEVTAWRVTLWDGDKLLDVQKSFLW